MDALEALRTRRSIRAYTEQEVPRDLIEQVVDAGRLAASARNLQPWEFVVVTDPRTRQAIADLTEYGKHIAKAPVCIAVFCKDSTYYLEDGSAATQNMLVAARALGLGTCWIAGDKKPFADDVRRILGVPDGIRLVSLISMGYPAEQPVREKRPLSDLLHWERFGGK
jgi:nitroreductase